MMNDENTEQIGVKETVVGRVNDARPFEQQELMRLNELSARLDGLRASLEELRTELDRPGADQEKLGELAAAHREAIAALRDDFLKCCVEINEPVRWANQRLGILNHDFLDIRVEQCLLEERVKQIEQRSA